MDEDFGQLHTFDGIEQECRGSPREEQQILNTIRVVP